MHTLNGARYLYSFIANGIPSYLELSPSGKPICDEAMELVEKLRISICEQFKLSPDITWENIFKTAGCSPEDIDEASEERFKKSMLTELNPEANEIFHKLEIYRYQITGRV